MTRGDGSPARDIVRQVPARNEGGKGELRVRLGMVYAPGLQSLFNELGDAIDVVEIEPQTLWHPADFEASELLLDPGRLESIARLPWPKLLHGIGYPVGGSLSPDARMVPPFKEMVDALEPPWVSEHLSFNRAQSRDGEFYAGFLLPPRQTEAGVGNAVRAIRWMQDALGAPVAVETGVNYLKRRRDEMDDGSFVATIVEQAGCGILLDLHNIWANQLNGRQSVEDFVGQLPLDRVWEVHLAGGSEEDGYWLDSHSGKVPRPLLEILSRLYPQMRNLGAIIYELFPRYFPTMGPEAIVRELSTIRVVCSALAERQGEALHGSRSVRQRPDATPDAAASGPAAASPEEWENALGGLVAGLNPLSSLAADLRLDPGVALLRRLVVEFRASMLEDLLGVSLRLVSQSLGRKGLADLLIDFWNSVPPELWPTVEARNFADYLARREPEVPLLPDALQLELALLGALLDGKSRTITVSTSVADEIEAGGTTQPVGGRLVEVEIVGTAENRGGDVTIDPGILGARLPAH